MSLHYTTPLRLLSHSPWLKCLGKNFPTIHSPKTASKVPSEGIFFLKTQNPGKHTFINRLLKMTLGQEIAGLALFLSFCVHEEEHRV